MIIARMREQVKELAGNQSLILNEDDLEFILGLEMLMDMEEPVDSAFADRVNQIYAKAARNADAWRV